MEINNTNNKGSINKAIDLIKSNIIDFVWPFGYCKNSVDIDNNKKLLNKQFDKVYTTINYTAEETPGGIIVCNTDKFLEAGGLSDHIKRYGPEDKEFKLRIQKLGYNIARLNEYYLYHLWHPTPDDYRFKKDNMTDANSEEYESTKNMRPHHLKRIYPPIFK